MRGSLGRAGIGLSEGLEVLCGCYAQDKRGLQSPSGLPAPPTAALAADQPNSS